MASYYFRSDFGTFGKLFQTTTNHKALRLAVGHPLSQKLNKKENKAIAVTHIL